MLGGIGPGGLPAIHGFVGRGDISAVAPAEFGLAWHSAHAPRPARLANINTITRCNGEKSVQNGSKLLHCARTASVKHRDTLALPGAVAEVNKNGMPSVSSLKVSVPLRLARPQCRYFSGARDEAGKRSYGSKYWNYWKFWN